MEPGPDTSNDWVARLKETVAMLNTAGITRIESFAWRDLADPDAGGSEVHADEVLSRWATAGLAIDHRTSTDSSPEHLTRGGYAVTRKGGRYSVFARVIFAKLFRRARSDTATVEIWNGVPWFSQLWRHPARMVWLHHIHEDMWKDSVPAPLAPIARFIEVRIAPLLYRRTIIATLAYTTRDQLIERGFNPDRVVVAEPGIDPRYSPLPDTRSSGPTLVAVGRLAPVKRFDLLVKAFVDVVGHDNRAHLTIAGEGPDRPALEELIESLGLAEHVTLAGRVSDDELLDLYRRSWLLVSASHSEGWGMTITEAAACGTPCVVTRNHGHEAAAVHGQTGLLVDDDDQLAPTIIGLLDDQETRERLGYRALGHASRFTWDRTASLLLAGLWNSARNVEP